MSDTFYFCRVKIFWIALFLFGPLAMLAQDDDEGPRVGSTIVDDTTKQIYGPRTSKYFLEQDIFLNREAYHQVDTAIRNFHRFTELQRHENMYQDLGVVGTAVRPIYFEVPDQLGVTSGFNSYDAYWERETIKYWDTKSPYTNMNAILGGRGRSVTRVTYSRNINPRWNFGGTYRGMFIDKQISRQAKGDRNTRGHYYDFFTTFQSKDSTYRIFANFRRGNHETAEFGGVRNDVPGSFTYKNFFTLDSQPWLTEAVARELRINLHLFHQYKVGEALQAYHKLDRYRQSNRFTDSPGSEPDYDFVMIDTTATNDKVKFSSFRNELGIKGSLSKLFYNGYIAFRDYTMSYTYDTLINGESQNVRKGTEKYLGGRIALKLDSLVDVIGWGEVLQDKGAIKTYRIEGSIRSKWFDASVKQVAYVPTFLQQYYLGSHDFWKNNFDNVNTTQLSGALHYRSSVIALSPGALLTRVGNYIFFRRDTLLDRRSEWALARIPDTNPEGSEVRPFQDPGENVIFSPSLRLELTLLRHIRLSGLAIYSTKLDKTELDPFQIPELLVNGQLSYENIFFNGNLDMHAGVDIHWKSAYNGLAYDVATQQFYVQNGAYPSFNGIGERGYNFTGGFVGDTPNGVVFQTPVPEGVKNFPLVDVFFSAKIKRGRVFFKYNNIIQAFTKQGYFITPMYPGQRNTFDFGFDWSFYD
jgi:hypothetical protein